ncbi:bifunctional UDP-N-acetylglucosamine diphosphorylase/glucosamine-1-phosphate N-acetyltransferase GlmU [Gammaproteobacteria bacterium]|nr:bifunctional UDP-N-acetylglucosamine diphosphorylase/glucosamine-1-phosphate N-acetyltransferase GlmU [Gammaproteobacteria bacterium]
MNIHTIVLAAGAGSRMKSNQAKVLQRIGGMSMLQRVLQTTRKLNSKSTVVLGHDKEGVLRHLQDIEGNISTVIQANQLGTADAVKSAMHNTTSDETILVLYGDVPLISEKSLQELIDKSENGFSILTTHLDDPFGYGRVVTDTNNFATAIVEEKDASDDEKLINEIFTGILCINQKLLAAGLQEITNNNAAKEFYLTDLVKIISAKGIKIIPIRANNNEVRGANSKSELESLESILRNMNAQDLLDKGITLADKSRTDVRGTVDAGNDCSIDVNVILEGSIKLGNGVSIGANNYLKDVIIGDNTTIEPFSHLCNANVGSNCNIGPYARLREGSTIEDDVSVGNFVETKKTTLGKGVKANHFTYLGDADIGENTNIGAGTITCNYDGTNKHQTTVGSDSFIGTNSSLVAPIEIGKNAYVGAGSVITKNVPDDALAVGRGKQVIKEDWSKDKK